MKAKLNTRTIVKIAAYVLVIVLSIGLISPVASNPETYKNTIAKLREKQVTVMEVTAAATASSIAIGVIPEDATTPIANKIMDLAGYLIVVLCAIFIEKYILTLAGFITFTFLVPLVCVLGIINLFLDKKTISRNMLKILSVGIVILAVVPLSVQISNIIEATADFSISLPAEYQSIRDTAEQIVTAEETDSEDSVSSTAENETGLWNNITNGASKAWDSAKNTVNEISDWTSDLVISAVDVVGSIGAKAQDMFWDLVEKVVVLIILDLVFPILTLMFMLWAIKVIIGMPFDVIEVTKDANNPTKRFTGRLSWKNTKKDSEEE